MCRGPGREHVQASTAGLRAFRVRDVSVKVCWSMRSAVLAAIGGLRPGGAVPLAAGSVIHQRAQTSPSRVVPAGRPREAQACPPMGVVRVTELPPMPMHATGRTPPSPRCGQPAVRLILWAVVAGMLRPNGGTRR